MPRDTAPLDVETLILAYAAGVFPMAESRDDPEVFWVDPTMRGILPLDGLRLSRSLARRVRSGRFKATLNADFAGVLAGCAERPETWINAPIAALYLELHARGLAHSLEVWDEGELAGGVYGVALGGAFFGESMFSRRRDASKVALATLVALLRRQGFALFDTQFPTAHLASLGGTTIPRAAYRRRLRHALDMRAVVAGPVPQPGEVTQRSTQTS